MRRDKSKYIVAALSAVVMFSLPLAAVAQDGAGDLLEELGSAQNEAQAQRIEKALFMEWSKSGSAAMDLLLKRGRDALEINDTGAAIEHLTALTDHAPEFAEG